MTMTNVVFCFSRIEAWFSRTKKIQTSNKFATSKHYKDSEFIVYKSQKSLVRKWWSGIRRFQMESHQYTNTDENLRNSRNLPMMQIVLIKHNDRWLLWLNKSYADPRKVIKSNNFKFLSTTVKLRNRFMKHQKKIWPITGHLFSYVI